LQELAFEQDEIFRNILYRPSSDKVTIHDTIYDTIHDDMLIRSLLINLEGDKTYHRDNLMEILGYGRREDILLNGKFEIYSVRNPQARNNLKEMKMGDSVLFFHIKQPRLSVIKLTKEEFESIVELL
jgi:hypothetical protein